MNIVDNSERGERYLKNFSEERGFYHALLSVYEVQQRSFIYIYSTNLTGLFDRKILECWRWGKTV